MIAARRQDFVRMLVLAATTAAFALCMSVVVVAQSSAHNATVSAKHARNEANEAQGERDERFQKMTKHLKLTDDQSTRMKAIMQEQWTESGELRAKYKGQSNTPENKAAMMNARKDLHASTDAKIAQVLTAPQMTEYRKMRADHMKHMNKEKNEKDEAK